MKLSEQQQIFSKNIASLIVYADTLDIGLTFGHAYRDLETQKRMVATGKSKTLNSNHLKRLAVDFNFFINGKLTYDKHKLKALGEFWEGLHPKNRWGGNFKSFTDTPHFEMNI
jgi:hypothetical protein